MLSEVGVCQSSTVLRQLEAILQPNLDPEKETVALDFVAFPDVPVGWRVVTRQSLLQELAPCPLAASKPIKFGA
jgi:hypothetical protein